MGLEVTFGENNLEKAEGLLTGVDGLGSDWLTMEIQPSTVNLPMVHFLMQLNVDPS